MSDNDIFSQGIAHWAATIRSGKRSFRQSIEVMLDNIQQASSLNAFEHIASTEARQVADKLDRQLASGNDLGPAMGVPLGIKDIMAVDGMPTTNGSNADTRDITGAQGTVVTRLSEAGAIVIGKTKTVEFALGATGVNESRGTPQNPVDRDNHRIPGGSSSGSAVATSAGLVGMALGTDTGGSVRIPACYTGIVGHKTSVGLWPTDGVFALSPTLDSIGPLTRTVSDAIMVHQLITGKTVDTGQTLSGLKFGIVEDLFMEDLDDKVADDFENACLNLEKHGASRVSMRFPEVHERNPLFTSIVPAELISNLSPERFMKIRDSIDTVTAERAQVGLDTTAHAYLSAQRRRLQLVNKALATFEDVDAWISPTCPMVPMTLSEMATKEGHERGLLSSRNTQPGNLLDFCALTLPMHSEGLPTGFQIMMPLHADAKLLSLSAAVETCIARDISSMVST